MQQQNAAGDGYTGVWGGVAFPEVFQWNFPPVHNFSNPVRDHDPFLLPSPPPPPPPCSFTRRPFGYDGGSSENHLRLISESLGGFGLHAELQKMTAQEIMDAKALAASKSHSEAERRRRERIKTHLDKLRSLLPSTTKTDKASLLAEVIQHVKELKRQTLQIAETSAFPTEVDELSVENASDEAGKLVIKTSICCKDRADLLPDLISTLKALKLKTLKAEITTLGGRVKNVLFITRDDDEDSEALGQQQLSISSIQEAFKSVMEKCSGDESGSGTVKRQRTNTSIK